MATLKDALWWRRQGKAIFPVYEIDENGKCACGDDDCHSAGKHPYGSSRRPGSLVYSDMRDGCKEATTNEEQIRIWWKRWPNANIGLATGTINRCVALDFDGEKGMANYSVLMNGTRPEDTLSMDTGGGGMHLVFETDEPFPNRRNILGPHSGVDMRGEGGYIVAPPSNHKSGNSYSFHTKRKPIPLPEYLVKRFKEIDDEGPAGHDPVGESDWTRVVNDGEGRDDYLIRMAGSLARSKMPYKELATTLWGLNRKNVRPPKNKRAIIRIAKSACKMERDRLAGLRSKDFTPAEIIREAAEEPEPAQKGFLIDSKTFERRYAGQQVEWLIRDWIPEASLGMLLAPYEAYKTWFLIDLLMSLSGSRPLFLDHFPVFRTGTCMFFQQEDSFARLWERVATVLRVKPVRRSGNILEIPMPPNYPRVLWHVARELNMRNKQALMDLDRSIRKYRPIFCAIDPMYTLLELKDYGMESAKELSVFRTMVDHYGLSFLIAHHMNKSEKAGRARDNSWGSIFLQATMQYGIEMIPQPKAGLLQIERHEKNSPRPPLLNVQFNFDPYNYHVDVEEETGNDLAEKTEAVRELLSTTLVKTQTDLMKKTGINGKQTLANILSNLGAYKEGHFYKLPESERIGVSVKGDRNG